MTHVVDTKIIKGPGDLDLLLGIKKGVGELLSLTQSTLDDLEARDIAQEIGDAAVVAVGIPGGGGVRVLASLNTGEARVIGICSSQYQLGLCWSEYLPLAPLACPLGSGSAPGHIVGVSACGLEGLEGLRGSNS